MNKTFGIADALQTLTPGAQWVLNGDSYSGLQWLDKDQEQPTEEALIAEIERIRTEWNALEYQRLRAAEYPDFRDYLDGVVKDDQEQVQAYIDACLAVKAKYPKP